MERLTTWFSLFLDALFPRACVLCKEEGRLLCCACEEKLDISSWTYRTLEGDFRIASRVSYKERAVQKLLHAWKYQGDTSAENWWKTWMTEEKIPDIPKGSAFVPVPLAREAFAERGFNQAEVLAQALAQAYEGSCLKILARLPRKSQAKTEKHERGILRKNNPYHLSALGEALQYEKNLPQTVILVDDVTTTGSTLLACRDVLASAGVKDISACTLAYGNAE